MAFAINKVILIGHLGQNPEINTLGNGIKVASFSIATTESYKDKDGEYQDVTEWHKVQAWRWLADLAEKHLKKGSKVYVEGKLKTRSYEQDGVTKYTTEIVAKEIITMFDSPKRAKSPVPIENDEPKGKKKTEPLINKEEGEDDLPF